MSSDPTGITGFIPIFLILVGFPLIIALILVMNEIKNAVKIVKKENTLIVELKQELKEKTIEIPLVPAIIIAIVVLALILILVL